MKAKYNLLAGVLLSAAAIVLCPAYSQEILCSFPGPQGTNSSLAQGNDGNFYGTSSAGGTSGKGTVFRMTPGGALTTLVSFTGGNDGGQPYAGVIQGSDGNFYGTTSQGGAKNFGTVFKMNPNGAVTTLVSFNGTGVRDGAIPYSGLVQGSDGNFYGTTYWGGDKNAGGGSGLGTVFTITPSGVKSNLVIFEGPNGGHPFGGLIQGNDGNFYGTTYWGGNVSLNGGNGFGSIFRVTPGGQFSMLATFDGTHGGHPYQGVVQGNDGNFYGTTYWGGSTLNDYNGYGTVFQMTPDGTLTMLVGFTNDNGAHPFGGLVQGIDGNFYGTTLWGGNLSLNGFNGLGTVFKVTPAGDLTTLFSFSGDNGSLPYATLILGSDNNIYGTTCQGGAGGGGVVFRLDVGAPLGIVVQPSDLAVPLGADATFRVIASGIEPITYQWFSNGGLVGPPTSTLTISDTGFSNAGSYWVVLSNSSGSITSRLATLQVGGFAPAFARTASFQNSAVDLGEGISFAPAVSGDAPLAFQWQLNGHDMDGQTNSTLAISGAQASDEGDYTLTVSNALGTLTSDPVRLWVTPPVASFIGGNFTNSGGLRLPYFYVLPPNYDPNLKYPLLCWLHGSPGNETAIVTPNSLFADGQPLASHPQIKVLASLGRQQTDPGILLWPTRRAGDSSWTTSYIQLLASFLDQITNVFNIDTNRLYLEAGSEGVHAAWDLAAMRPNYFAGGRLMDGYSGSSSASAVAGLPLWLFHAATDVNVDVSNSRTMVRNLRLARGKPIYTEYTTGDHLSSIQTGEQTPGSVDWLVAQRKGTASAHGPLLAITSQFGGTTPTTAGTNVTLAGVADALGQPVSSVTWTNTTLGFSGNASGSTAWIAAGVPLRSGQTSLLLVTGSTVSWSPVLGGNTTINDSLNLLSSPIHASLGWQNGGLLLNWTGGAAPFQVQMTTNVASGNWQLFRTKAMPPITLSPTDPAEFYRVLGP
jgi:uncharacterized repeat protein (TIGR03803 family)